MQWVASVFGQQECVPVSAFHLVQNTMHILKGSLASLIPLPISTALSNICSCFRRFIHDMPVHGTGLTTLSWRFSFCCVLFSAPVAKDDENISSLLYSHSQKSNLKITARYSCNFKMTCWENKIKYYLFKYRLLKNASTVRGLIKKNIFIWSIIVKLCVFFFKKKKNGMFVVCLTLYLL